MHHVVIFKPSDGDTTVELFASINTALARTIELAGTGGVSDLRLCALVDLALTEPGLTAPDAVATLADAPSVESAETTSFFVDPETLTSETLSSQMLESPPTNLEGRPLAGEEQPSAPAVATMVRAEPTIDPNVVGPPSEVVTPHRNDGGVWPSRPLVVERERRRSARLAHAAEEASASFSPERIVPGELSGDYDRLAIRDLPDDERARAQAFARHQRSKPLGRFGR